MSSSSCDDIFELLSAATDGEATVEELDALDRHLESCPACAQLLDRLSHDRRQRMLATPVLSHGLLQRRIAAAIDGNAKRRRPPAAALAGVAASFLLVIGSVVVVDALSPGEADIDGHRRGELVADHATHTVIELANGSFDRSALVVNAGSSVTWRNVSNRVHELVRIDGATTVEGTIAPGAQETVTFLEPGVYTYECTSHSGITGRIVVA